METINDAQDEEGSSIDVDDGSTTMKSGSKPFFPEGSNTIEAVGTCISSVLQRLKLESNGDDENNNDQPSLRLPETPSVDSYLQVCTQILQVATSVELKRLVAEVVKSLGILKKNEEAKTTTSEGDDPIVGTTTIITAASGETSADNPVSTDASALKLCENVVVSDHQHNDKAKGKKQRNKGVNAKPDRDAKQSETPSEGVESTDSEEVLHRRARIEEELHDPLPTRLANPLLTLPPFPETENGAPLPIDLVPNGAELWNLTEGVYFVKPKTYPLAYWARLLGFRVPATATGIGAERLTFDPNKVPLRVTADGGRYDPWQSTPTPGLAWWWWRQCLRNRLSADVGASAGGGASVESSPSSVKRARRRTRYQGLQRCRFHPGNNGDDGNEDGKVIDKCMLTARSMGVIDDRIKFRWVEDKNDDDFSVNTTKTFSSDLSARGQSLCKTLIAYRCAEDEKEDDINLATVRFRYAWLMDVNVLGKEETEDDESNDEDDESKEGLHDQERNDDSTVAEDGSTQGGGGGGSAMQGNDAEFVQCWESVEVSTEFINDAAKNRRNSGVLVVLLARCLEHARSVGGVGWCLWDAPPSLASQVCGWFRMATLPSITTTTDDGRSVPETLVPTLCDLSNCSYLYAFRSWKKEQLRQTRVKVQSSPTLQKGDKEEESTALRMLVKINPPLLVSSPDTVPVLETPTKQFSLIPATATLPALASSIMTESAIQQNQQRLPGPDFQVRIRLEFSSSRMAEVAPKVMRWTGHNVTDEWTPVTISPDAYKDIDDKEYDKELRPEWNVLRVFPRPPQQLRQSPLLSRQVSLSEQDAHPNNNADEDDLVSELRRQQKRMVEFESAMEPKLRFLLRKVMEEEAKGDNDDWIRRQEEEAAARKAYAKILEKRKEAEAAWATQLEQDMDAVCDVCHDGEVQPGNQILFCEACNVAVHQRCYVGIDGKIPSGDWYCLACRASGGRPPTTISCVLCPRKQGAYVKAVVKPEEAKNRLPRMVERSRRLQRQRQLEQKQENLDPKEGDDPTATNEDDMVCPAVSSASFIVNAQVTQWVHMVCAKWFSCPYIESPVEGEAPDSVEIDRAIIEHFRRNEVPCKLCESYRGGMIQCFHGIDEEGQRCKNLIHVTCARSSGLCRVVHGVDHGGELEETPERGKKWTVLCPDHSGITDPPPGSVSCEQLKSAAATLPIPPMPAPDFGRFQKMDGPTRRKFFEDPLREDDWSAKVLARLEGARCEICYQPELQGNCLAACADCGVVVHPACYMSKYADDERYMAVTTTKSKTATVEKVLSKPKQPPFRCEACLFVRGRRLAPLQELDDNPNDDSPPRCNMCPKGDGILVRATAQPSSKKFKKRNPEKYEMSMWGKRLWCHTVCAMWHPYCYYDSEIAELSNVIMGNGDRVVSYQYPCALCGLHEGIKVVCAECLSEHKNKKKGNLYHYYHILCARQAGLEVADETKKAEIDGVAENEIKFFVHCDNHSTYHHHKCGGTARLADPLHELLEIERLRVDLNLEDAEMPMSMSHAARVMHQAVTVLSVLGWAWSWAPPDHEELAALGAALRHRDYDTAPSGTLEKGLRTVLSLTFSKGTSSADFQLRPEELDFVVEWLGRAYRSMSPLLGFGEEAVRCDDKLPHRLGDRPLPGTQENVVVPSFLPTGSTENRDNTEIKAKEKVTTEPTPTSTTMVVVKDVAPPSPTQPTLRNKRGRPKLTAPKIGTKDVLDNDPGEKEESEEKDEPTTAVSPAPAKPKRESVRRESSRQRKRSGIHYHYIDNVDEDEEEDEDDPPSRISKDDGGEEDDNENENNLPNVGRKASTRQRKKGAILQQQQEQQILEDFFTVEENEPPRPKRLGRPKKDKHNRDNNTAVITTRRESTRGQRKREHKLIASAEEDHNTTDGDGDGDLDGEVEEHHEPKHHHLRKHTTMNKLVKQKRRKGNIGRPPKRSKISALLSEETEVVEIQVTIRPQIYRLSSTTSSVNADTGEVTYDSDDDKPLKESLIRNEGFLRRSQYSKRERDDQMPGERSSKPLIARIARFKGEIDSLGMYRDQNPLTLSSSSASNIMNERIVKKKRGAPRKSQQPHRVVVPVSHPPLGKSSKER